MNSDSRLATISHVTFILTCIVLVSLALARAFGVPAGYEIGARDNPLLPGSNVLAIEGLTYSKSNLTVAVVIHSDCRFCGESIPFYQKLATYREEGRVQVAALSREPIEQLTEYVTQHGLTVDVVARIRGAEIPTTGTPTLVLIGRDGRVIASWLGRLSKRQERDVIRQIHVAAPITTKSGSSR